MSVNSNVVTSTSPAFTSTSAAIDAAAPLAGLAAQQRRIVGLARLEQGSMGWRRFPRGVPRT